MKTKLLFLFALLASNFLTAQNECAADLMRAYSRDRGHDKTAETDINIRIYNQILSSGSQRGSEEIYTIPVVVHVIHENGGENISDESVQIGVERLNEAFANTSEFSEIEGINTGIQFCLAQQDEDGEFTTGINHVFSELTEHFVPSATEDLKNVIRWDTQRYMNIWVVASITRDPDQTGVIGYATFPQSHGSSIDGIVVEAVTFSGGDFIKVLIHETGHYLGLFHTFENGCNNNDCLFSGDHICDTPPDNSLFDITCSSQTNSCSTDDDDISLNNPFRPIGLGGEGDQNDMVNNYMDYSGINCFRWFTQGQSERMGITLETIRSSLLNSVACYPPCDNPIFADATASSTVINSGESIIFNDLSTGASFREWKVNNFLMSSNSEYIFNETQQGFYLVELILYNDEPGCTATIEFLIEVICPVVASFDYSIEYVLANENVIFQNTSTGAQNYTWYVDGMAVSNDENLNYSFDENGFYFIELEAFGTNCSSISPAQLINVGNCSIGNEANNWVFYVDGGSSDGLNFNTNPTSVLDVNVPSYAEGKSTLCDADGNMIFTTQGSIIYDGNFNPIPDGTGILGHFSSRDGVMFVRAPESENLIYLFSQDNQEADYVNGLRYTLIDQSLNNGIGAVVPEEKNVFIESARNEAFTAIRHCNGTDFWLVTKNNLDNEMKAFLVDAEGVNLDAIVSPAGPQSNGINHTREFAINARYDYVFHDKTVYHFNPLTGECDIVRNFSEETFYGAFSPNGKLLYLLYNNNNNIQAYQIDLSLPADEWINQAYIFVPSNGANSIPIDCQIAPDGKIYIPIVFGTTIGVINNPNAIGDACNFNPNQVMFNGLINSMGNYFHAYTSGQTIFVEGNEFTCAGVEESYTIAQSECIEASANWNLPDGGVITSNENGNIAVQFEEQGLYRIVASIQLECGIETDTMYVEVSAGLTIDLGPDINICLGTGIILDAGPGAVSYEWQDQSSEQTFTANAPGIYSVVISNDQGCNFYDEIEILQVISGAIDLGPDLDLCDNEPIILDAGNDFLNYTWQDGSSGPTFTVYEGGTYTVIASNPCDASDSIFIDECGHSINIEDIESETTINVYPNPANDVINISGNKTFVGTMIEIYDSKGSLITTEIAVESVLRINTKNWPTGLYHIRINGREFKMNSRVIVNH